MSNLTNLLPQAAVIRDATTEGENTALRVGKMFVDLIQAVDELLSALSAGQDTLAAAAAGAKLSSCTKEVVEDAGGSKHIRLKVAQADGTYKTVDLDPASDSVPGLLSPGMHAQFWADHQTMVAHSATLATHSTEIAENTAALATLSTAQEAVSATVGTHSAAIGSVAAELAQIRVPLTGAGVISVGASAAHPLTLSVADGAGRLPGGASTLTVAEYKDNIAVSAACRLTIDNKYNIQKLAAQADCLLDGFDIAQLRHSSLLAYLYMYRGCARGWLSDLPVSPLRHLDIRYCADVRGQLSSLGGYTQAQLIRLCGCGVGGDVAALSGCVALSALDLHDTEVSGELTDLLDAMAGHRAPGEELTVDLRQTEVTYQDEAIEGVMKFRFTVTARGWVCLTAPESGWTVGGGVSTETPSIDVGVPASDGGGVQIGAAYRMTKGEEVSA